MTERPPSDAFRGHLGEIVRFGAVGTVALIVHYGVYRALLPAMSENAAFAIGFVASFLCNFVLTTLFTFHVGFAMRRFVRFTASHAVNYIVQAVLLNFFLFVGVPPTLAPLPVYAISVPISFLLVRLSMLGKNKSRSRGKDTIR